MAFYQILSFCFVILLSNESVLGQNNSATSPPPTTKMPPSCVAACAQGLMVDMNMTSASDIQNMLDSPNPIMNKPGMLLRMCTQTYTNLKTCLNSCPSGDALTLMNMGLSSLDYVCRDHLQEFLNSSGCCYNVTQSAIGNECKTNYMSIVNTTKSMMQITSYPNVTVNDTVGYMDTTCGLAYELVKCVDPLIAKSCGQSAARLHVGLFGAMADSFVDVIDYLNGMLSQFGYVVASPIKCAKARIDSKNLAYTHT